MPVQFGPLSNLDQSMQGMEYKEEKHIHYPTN